MTLVVNADQTAVIKVSDGNYNIIERYVIDYTDIQIGAWRFYLVNTPQWIPEWTPQWTLMLPSNAGFFLCRFPDIQNGKRPSKKTKG